jgi:hypothetical protein
MDEGGTEGRREEGIVAADHHGVRGIARVLGELGGRGGLDDLAAHAALEADPLALHLGARVLEEGQRLRVVAELHADLLEDGIGVPLDDLAAFVAQDVEGADAAPDIRRAGHGRLRRSALPRPALAPAPAAFARAHPRPPLTAPLRAGAHFRDKIPPARPSSGD